jgi:class 3 adenylate cyclase/predicted ATPase
MAPAGGWVEEWLRAIGLERHIDGFRAERIELAQIVDLTEADLKEIGLTIGERRRFHRAVLELQAAPPPAATATATVAPSTFAERRPLTMVFIDLVGSSELGELLEPEDLMEVIRRYREACGQSIRRYGGSVARQIGDGILAYFSYPVATENDPEGAVRAALSIVRTLPALETPAPGPLSVRIGIATGRVIISDMVSGGAADLRTIIGTAPNLAARLQSVGEPGWIVIAPETHERVLDLFACSDLGEIVLRGFTRPRRAWRVLQEMPRPAGRSTATPRHLTSFFARQDELAILHDHWSRAAAGAGQTVLMSGEAGIGKTRLIETFLALHCSKDCRVLQLEATPFDVDSPLLPFAAWLRAEAGAKAGDAGRALPDDLVELLGVAPAASAIGDSPAQLRELILSTLTDLLLALSEAGPLCAIVEDLHWLDPSSLEVLERLATRIDKRRVMLLVTARDGFEAPWLRRNSVTSMRLARLTPKDIAEIVRGIVDYSALPAALVEEVVRKSDGVPLFAVELLRAVLNADGSPISALPPHVLPDEPSTAIPALLRDSLMARLDRAGLAKEVAQIAAVLGRSVRADLLAKVSGRPQAELEEALAALVTAGVLRLDQIGTQETYTFTHALLRDVAYDSVLRDQRRGMHLRVAETLPDHDPDLTAQRPELLALHLSEGGKPELAVPHWTEAARRSLKRSALTEATRLLRRGIGSLGDGWTELRLQLTALLGPALIGLNGPGSAEARHLYESAALLCQDRPESAAFFPIYWGWWRTAKDLAARPDRAETLLRRARLLADDGLLLEAHHCAWASHYVAGGLEQSRLHAEAGLAIYAAGHYEDHAGLYGNHDARVCAHGELCEVFCQTGRLQQALSHERLALDWAHGLKHLGSIVHALDCAVTHRAYRRDVRQVFSYANELARLATEHGLADHQSKSLILKGWAVAVSEDLSGGLRMLQEGIARQRDIGSEEDFPVYWSLLGEVLTSAGRADEAVAHLQEAHQSFAASGLQAMVPDMLRVLGEATIASNPADEASARAWLTEAARMAAEHGAHFLSLRAAISLARLDLQRGATEGAAASLVRALGAVDEDDNATESAEAAWLLKRYAQHGYSVEGVA